MDDNVEVRKLTIHLNNRPINILVPIQVKGANAKRTGRHGPKAQDPERGVPVVKYVSKREREEMKKRLQQIEYSDNKMFHKSVKEKYVWVL